MPCYRCSATDVQMHVRLLATTDLVALENPTGWPSGSQITTIALRSAIGSPQA